MNKILKQKQFKDTKQTTLNKKEELMNKYILKLHNDKAIDTEIYWKIRSTCSSYATLYEQPKIHKANYPLRPIISSINTYNPDLSQYLYQIIKNNRPSLNHFHI